MAWKVNVQNLEEIGRLPSLVHGGAAVATHLVAQGKWERLSETVKISRKGGFCAEDALLYLILFLSQKTCVSLRGFYQEVYGWRTDLGALVGRTHLMSPSSLSRLMGRAELKEVASFWRPLLWEMSNLVELHRRSDVQHTDREGKRRHVLYFDPTSFAVRERALPEDETLPKPRRHQAGMTAPGYTGRKRGENIARMGVLTHGGSGAVIHVTLTTGNEGSTLAQFAAAMQAAADFAAAIDHPLTGMMVCADGEFGGVPYLDAARRHGVPLITRCVSPTVLEIPQIRRNLRKATWRPVPDSGSGPQRWATELGRVRLQPSRPTQHPDGTPVQPVDVRLVASRYVDEGGNGCGILLEGGVRLELFAVLDVPQSAFSSADVVHLFYSRCGQENLFDRLDKEYRIKRIHSYSLAGQLLCVLVGCGLWNLDLSTGQVGLPIAEPLDLDVQARGPAPEPLHLPRLKPSRVEVPENKPPQRNLEQLLRELDWEEILKGRPEWRWKDDTAQLVDDEGLCFDLSWVQLRGTSAELRFVTRAEDPQVAAPSFSVPPDQAEAIKQALRRQRRTRKRQVRPRKGGRRTTGGCSHRFVAEPTTTPGGVVGLPGFLAASARRRGRTLRRQVEVHISVSGPRGPAPRTRTRHDRSHRRLTWEQHRNRYRCSPDVRIEITLRTPEGHPYQRYFQGEPMVC